MILLALLISCTPDGGTTAGIQVHMVWPRDDEFVRDEPVHFEMVVVLDDDAIDPKLTWTETGHGRFGTGLSAEWSSSEVGIHEIEGWASWPASDHGQSTLGSGVILQTRVRSSPPPGTDMDLWDDHAGVPDTAMADLTLDDGRVLVGTHRGLAVVGETVQVVRPERAVRAVERIGDEIWVGYAPIEEAPDLPVGERFTLDLDPIAALDPGPDVTEIRSIAAGPGGPWVGTDAGIAVLGPDGWVRRPRATDRVNVLKVVGDHVWSGGDLGVSEWAWDGHLVEIQHIRPWNRLADEYSVNVTDLLVGDDGVWAVSPSQGVALVLPNGRVETYEDMVQPHAIARLGDATWVGSSLDGLWRLDATGAERFGTDWFPGRDIETLVADGEDLWVGSDDGLVRIRP